MTQTFKEHQDYYQHQFSTDRDLVYNNKERYQVIFDLIDEYARPSTEAVLDVGAGRGTISSYLSQSGVDVLSVDIVGNDNLLQYESELERLSVTLGRLPDLPVGTDEFDLVVCSEVLEHLPRPVQKPAVRELSRVAAPGGRVILSTPNPRSIHELTRPSRDGQYVENWIKPDDLGEFVSSHFEIVERLGSYYLPGPVTMLVYNVPGLSKLRELSESIRESGRLSTWGLYQYYVLEPRTESER